MPVDATAAGTAPRHFDHRAFDAASLVARKRAAGQSVTVVIPARDEEPRVGHVVETLHTALVVDQPLIDELVVVDADSRDRTAQVATAAGARVIRQSAVLPEAGSRPGKGEALWKGLAATDGDLVAFVDGDILDIGPRFVTGLVGPLLTDPAVSFVKASYDRPLQIGGTHLPTGGGRVTEIMARPLIGAFWPQLAWLAQPLSGEYAGRRDVLEGLPFVCGYGVELALLIDLLEQHGPESIAQVDLGTRTHDHQSLDALGRMAAEILRVAVDRLERQRRLVIRDPLVEVLAQPFRDVAGDLAMADHPIHVEERPSLRAWRYGGTAGESGSAGPTRPTRAISGREAT